MNVLSRTVQMHKAIGHPVRLRLLSMLHGGPLCVCQMTVVAKLAGSTVSEHLSELRRAGLVVERKDGRWVEYRLAGNPAARQLLEAVWSDVSEDPEVKADSLVLRELRKVSLDDLCSAGLELGRIKRPKLVAALREAAKLRHAGQAAR